MGVPIVPAATSMLLRDRAGVLEVLLLKRNSKLAFAPSVWVFPGGRVDDQDGQMDQHNMFETVKNAAVRECAEETGINITSSSLHHFCKWTTPKGGNKRFETFFFHTFVNEESCDVTIDDSEIVDYLWLTPHQVLEKLFEKEITLLPPTFITIERIKNCRTYNDVKAEFNRTGLIIAEPVTTFLEGKFFSLYRGDSGYETADFSEGDSIHRLVMDLNTNHYSVQHINTSIPPVHGGVALASPKPI